MWTKSAAYASRTLSIGHVLLAQLQQVPIPLQHLPGLRAGNPCQFRAPERLRVFWVGHFAEVEVLELAATAFADCLPQLRILKVGEELEGRLLVEFLPHKQQRSVRGQQQQRCRQFSRSSRNERAEALALSTIAYLVMVLNADDVRRQGHVLRAGTSRSIPERIMLALVNVSLAQCAGNLIGLTKALVIALSLTGEERMHGMMKVVAPHRVQSIAAILRGSRVVRIVFVGLGDQIGRAHV